MVNANAKSPNRKRKSLPAGGESQSPKLQKVDAGAKTPNIDGAKTPKKGKSILNGNAKTPTEEKINVGANTPFKGKNTPGKGNQTPKATPQNNTPQKNAPNTPKPTPGKTPKQNKKTPPKNAVQKFKGTASLEAQDTKIKTEKPKKVKTKGDGKKKSQFTNLKQKVVSGDAAALAQLEEKIKAIQSRKDLSKTAKRKLKVLEKLRSVLTGEKGEQKKSVSQKRRERRKDVAVKISGKGDDKKKGNVVQEAESEEDEEGSESDENVAAGKIIKTEDDEEESGDEDSDEEDSENDDGEEEDESDGEEDTKPGKGKNTQPKQAENVQETRDKKTRYVLFTGNIPFDATRDDITEHFQKAGEIVDIRIPKDTKTNKPRGFAYVEFNNETSYQKGLSLHHTFLKGRRINVLYTQGGKKQGEGKKNAIRDKNLKLHAMRKQGQLAGSVKNNQKRSFRRGQKNAKTPVNGNS